MKFSRAQFTYSLLAILLQPSDAFWRLACSVSQTSRIDPILNPGTVSGHVHKFAGGNNVNADSTQDSLQSSTCSTCQVQQDKSAYWTPLLYYHHANGSIEEVQNDGMTVYYVGRGGTAANTVPFPKGFKMISGDSRLRSYDNTTLTYQNTRPIADRVSFRCINEANNIPETHGIDQTNCVNGLRAQINFQSCWNGVDLYKSDQSHVAYLSGIDYGDCPPTHPVPIPGLFFEVLYWSNRIDQTDGGKFVFANGDTTGYGFHGDFMNGWNQDVQTQAVKQCLYVDNGGVVEACAPLAASNDVNFPRTCPQSAHVIDEAVSGLLPTDALPGCNPITSGPQSQPQILCGINSTTPITSASILPTTIQPSSAPATLQTSAIPSSAPPIASSGTESRFTRTLTTYVTYTSTAAGVFADGAATFNATSGGTISAPSASGGTQVVTIAIPGYTTLALVLPANLIKSLDTSYSDLQEASAYIGSVLSIASAEAAATKGLTTTTTNTVVTGTLPTAVTGPTAGTQPTASVSAGAFYDTNETGFTDSSNTDSNINSSSIAIQETTVTTLVTVYATATAPAAVTVTITQTVQAGASGASLNRRVDTDLPVSILQRFKRRNWRLFRGAWDE